MTNKVRVRLNQTGIKYKTNKKLNNKISKFLNSKILL